MIEITFLIESTDLLFLFVFCVLNCIYFFFADIQQDDGIRKDSKNCKRDELTNKVFEGILQEKANTVSFKPTKSDKESLKVSIFILITK